MTEIELVGPGEVLRVAPGVVTTLSAPTVLGVRPYKRAGKAVRGVWEALIDDHDGHEPRLIWTEGPKAIRFIENYCIYTGGEYGGQPFKLMPWQKGWLIELFELLYDPVNDRFVQRYHEVLFGTPKKNGKSDMVAALGHYFFNGTGEPNPIIVAAAANETSANLLFTPMKVMVDGSGGAIERGALGEWCEPWESSILLKGALNAEIRRVPASPKSTEGLNIYINLCDEWHEWTHPAAEATATKIFNGTVLRPRYRNIRTTTAGFDKETLCGQDYEFGVALAAGEVKAPEWFFRWFEAPEEVDWRTEEAVKLANPSYGPLAQWAFYQNKLRREKEAIYERYFLNRWTSGEESWLPSGAWEACESKAELVVGAETFVGVDASYRNDATAIVAAQMQKLPALDGSDRVDVAVVVQSWIWQRPIDPHTRRPQADWVVPKDEVKGRLIVLAAVYKIRHVEYDPAFFHDIAMELAGLGLPMREFSQSNTRKLVDGCQATYQLVIRRELRHANERRFNAHIKAAVAVQVSTGAAGWVLRKGKARQKMDAAMALAMAVWGLQHPGEEEKKAKAPSIILLD